MTDDTEGRKPEQEPEAEREPAAEPPPVEAEAAAQEGVEQAAGEDGAPAAPPEPLDVTTAAPAEPPKREGLTRRALHSLSLHASAIAALAGVAAVIVAVVTLGFVISGDRRAARETVERQRADSLAAVDRLRTLEAVQRSAGATDRIATVQDSANHAARERAAAVRRAAQLQADAEERDRRDRVAVYDREIAVRLSLLSDSLRAIGLEPVGHNRNQYDLWRYTLAFRTFLRPRNVNGTWLEQKTTYQLVSGLRGPLGGSDPMVESAVKCLEKIAQSHEYTEPIIIVGSSARTALPDTAVFMYSQQYVGYQYLPVSEAFAALNLARWRGEKGRP